MISALTPRRAALALLAAVLLLALALPLTCATRPAYAAEGCVEPVQAVAVPCVGALLSPDEHARCLRAHAAVDRLTREIDAARMRAAAAVDLLAAERTARVEAMEAAHVEGLRADVAEDTRVRWAVGGVGVGLATAGVLVVAAGGNKAVGGVLAGTGAATTVGAVLWRW